MENDLVQWLMNWAFDHGISVTFNPYLPPSLPHCASAAKRKVLMNWKYGNPDEIPFALAHEIGHIVDDDPGTRYYKSATLHDKAEYRANLFGISLLKQYCIAHDISINSAIKFCEVFGIPEKLDYVVSLELSKG